MPRQARFVVYKRSPAGRMQRVGLYNTAEIEPVGQLPDFLDLYVVPNYGPGVYAVYEKAPDGAEIFLDELEFLASGQSQRPSFRRPPPDFLSPDIDHRREELRGRRYIVHGHERPEDERRSPISEMLQLVSHLDQAERARMEEYRRMQEAEERKREELLRLLLERREQGQGDGLSAAMLAMLLKQPPQGQAPVPGHRQGHPFRKG